MGSLNLTIIIGLALTSSGLGKSLWELLSIVLGYIRIENRIGELERRMELANADIADLVEKNT